MGKVNFVLRDSKDRIWITVSTRVNPWDRAVNAALADGYIALLDDTGLRIVADDFAFTNEIRLDANEEWLYVAETTGKRVSRLRVSLAARSSIARSMDPQTSAQVSSMGSPSSATATTGQRCSSPTA
jgi:sugar lactone lactonase YvrE